MDRIWPWAYCSVSSCFYQLNKKAPFGAFRVEMERNQRRKAKPQPEKIKLKYKKLGYALQVSTEIDYLQS